MSKESGVLNKDEFIESLLEGLMDEVYALEYKTIEQTYKIHEKYTELVETLKTVL